MSFQVFQSADGSYMTVEGDMDGVIGVGTRIKNEVYLAKLGLPPDATTEDIQAQFNQAQNLQIAADTRAVEAKANADAAIAAAEKDDDIIVIDDDVVVVPDLEPVVDSTPDPKDKDKKDKTNNSARSAGKGLAKGLAND